MDIKTIASVGRFKDIAVILLRYGFDDLVERLDLPGVGLIRKIQHTDRKLGTYERIRCALEDLGPTFVKFGQMMSLRPDLLPGPLVRELSKLQDDVSPMEFPQARAVVEKSLGRPLEEVFSAFDEDPVAAASVSQVHRAVLGGNGLPVAVKVQRPGIRKTIEKDLDILAAVLARVHERSEDLRPYDLPNVVRVARRNLLRELDFTMEARHMMIARSYGKDSGDIYVPKVYTDYSTEHVLVMEFIHGVKIKDLELGTLADSESLARQGLRAALKQILEDGFFHADPHPGNLILSEDRGLCLLDWGVVGRLTGEDRYELFHLVQSLVEKDGGRLADALLAIAVTEEEIDHRALERGILDIVDGYSALPIKELNIGQLLLDITALLRNHRLRLPPDLVIMIKALITAEGTARLIHPELNVMDEAEGVVRGLAGQHVRPDIVWRRLRSSLTQLVMMQRQLPRRLAQITDKIERGELAIRFEHENLGGLIHTLENTFSRLTLGIIIGSMIIGSSLIIAARMGPLLFGLPAMGIIGYLISGMLGLWLAFSIIRTRRY